MSPGKHHEEPSQQKCFCSRYFIADRIGAEHLMLKHFASYVQSFGHTSKGTWKRATWGILTCFRVGLASNALLLTVCEPTLTAHGLYLQASCKRQGLLSVRPAIIQLDRHSYAS